MAMWNGVRGSAAAATAAADSFELTGFRMFLLRHGQSYFNLHFNRTRTDPGIEDPELTPIGIEQARAAAAALSGTRLTRIIVSPYTRAVQTAQPFLRTHDASVVIMHEVRERAAFTCDVGSAPDLLAERFPHHDFDHLPREWWHRGLEPMESTVARADAFRAAMAARDDSATTLLVSHWAFILALTGRALQNGELLQYDPAAGAPPEIDWKS
jgi:broad specificity phosphatase PhoE